MAKKQKITKVRYVDVNLARGNFLSRLIGSKESYDLSDISLLRKLLSKEKAKILYLIKTKQPQSIYALAKQLGRDLKAVRIDLEVLHRFGFIDYQINKQGNKTSLKPILTADNLEIKIQI